MLKNFRGVYTQKTYNECTPRVGIFEGECPCLLMDIFSSSQDEIPYSISARLIELHDEIISKAADVNTPMISAVHTLVAEYRASISSGFSISRRYRNHRLSIETVILSASSVVLLDLGVFMSPSAWMKQTINFMDKHRIDYAPTTLKELGIDVFFLEGSERGRSI